MDIIIQFSTSNRSKNHLYRRSNCSCEDNVGEEEGTGGIVKIGDNFARISTNNEVIEKWRPSFHSTHRWMLSMSVISRWITGCCECRMLSMSKSHQEVTSHHDTINYNNMVSIKQ